MCTLFTFPKKSLKSMNKDVLLKTLQYFNHPVESTSTKSQLIQILEPYTLKDESFSKYNSRIMIQHKGYSYYVNINHYFKSFIVTKETTTHIYGDLLYGNGRTNYQLSYNKSSSTWEILNQDKPGVLFGNQLLGNQIVGVLYSIQYRCLMNNIHYLLNNNVVLSDIWVHLKSIVIETFPKNMFNLI